MERRGERRSPSVDVDVCVTYARLSDYEGIKREFESSDEKSFRAERRERNSVGTYYYYPVEATSSRKPRQLVFNSIGAGWRY